MTSCPPSIPSNLSHQSFHQIAYDHPGVEWRASWTGSASLTASFTIAGTGSAYVTFVGNPNNGAYDNAEPNSYPNPYPNPTFKPV